MDCSLFGQIKSTTISGVEGQVRVDGKQNFENRNAVSRWLAGSLARCNRLSGSVAHPPPQTALLCYITQGVRISDY
jgi:hypothetical protein